MTLIGLSLLSLGCLVVIGVIIGLAWEVTTLGAGDPPDHAISAVETQIPSSPEAVLNNTTLRKYQPYLLSPLGLACLVYLVSLILLLFLPALGDPGMLFLFAIIMVFTGFSAVSPILNLFQPRWWLNTVLYIVAWFLLFHALIGTLSWRAGEDLSIAAIGFGPAMLAAFFILPITALIKLVMYLASQSKRRL
jgi:uncharacterized membrane protein